MLELRNVTAGYGPHVVLRDVSLVVPDHAVVALLGANGAGKTTLLRVASGLLRPRSGQVLLDGEDVTQTAPHRRTAAGMCHVPEGSGVFPNLSVGQNICLQAPVKASGAALTQAAEAFPRLRERLAQRAGTMSGGEQQMLALARAYVSDPRVVLIDEVSMGLAPTLVDEMYQHLHRLASQGAALLLVEQYVARALNLAGYVYILDKGRIRFVGEPAELDDESVLASYFGSVTA